MLKKYFCPARIFNAERFRFHHFHQKVEESWNDFIVRLKKLSETCELGDFLEEALRNKFMRGFASEKIQSKQLSQEK